MRIQCSDRVRLQDSGIPEGPPHLSSRPRDYNEDVTFGRPAQLCHEGAFGHYPVLKQTEG